MQSDNDNEMPEAVAYIAAADLPLLKHGIAPISAEPTTPDDIALHTADQLRAAVLREREWWQADAERLNAARNALDRVIAHVGAEGEIDSSHPLVHESLDLLHAIDAARKEHP